MKKRYFLAQMLVFKDEARYLKEWLDYHLLAGVQHFYLFDNKSVDDPLRVLDWYINNNIVTYDILDIDFTWDSPAEPHRMALIKDLGHEFEWIGFNDMDEFLCLPNRQHNIHKILNNRPEQSAIALRRVDFGNNSLDKYDDRPVIERFPKRHATPHHFKSVARPGCVSGLLTGHAFKVKKDAKFPFTVDIHGKKIAGAKNMWTRCRPLSEDVLYINHYVCKSKEECFNSKSKYVNIAEHNKWRGTWIRFFKSRWSLPPFNEVDGGMNFFIKYLKDNFVQKNYLKIKQHYEEPPTKQASLADFIFSLSGASEIKS